MRRFTISIFILLCSTTFASVDTGTGADGACSWSGAIPGAEYNCTSLVTTGSVSITGATQLRIKVQGNVSIDHMIVIPAGNAGGFAPATGAVAGSEGGDGANAFCAGNFDSNGGGGGAGGAHASAGAAGTNGLDATPGGGDIPGVGASAASSTYDSALSLTTLIRGGSGGGSGGTGCDDSGTQPGSLGGAGGGVIHLSAGGVVVVNAQISANGANGANGASGFGDAGGSGGGAGGVVFLQSELDITLNANLSAQGGSGGTSLGTEGGLGGNGGNGIIRLDDSDGVITGAGVATPSATNIALNAVGLETLTSGIEPGCALREDKAFELNQLLGFILMTLLLVGLNLKEFKKRNTAW